jgi:hypothetical protein
MASSKTTAPATTSAGQKELLKNTENWVEQKLGFDPYYTPKQGDVFFATPADIDDKDPEFVRFIFLAEHDMQCARGPKKDAEPVTVAKNDTFSMGAYASLTKVFTDYVGMLCKITVGEKIEISGGHTLILFKLEVSPEDAAEVLKTKGARLKARLEEQRKTKQLPSHS